MDEGHVREKEIHHFLYFDFRCRNPSPYDVLNSAGLPIGIYTFHFGVDLLMNGSLDFDQLHYDSVDVNIK